jgi:hypothetical protein
LTFYLWSILKSKIVVHNSQLNFNIFCCNFVQDLFENFFGRNGDSSNRFLVVGDEVLADGVVHGEAGVFGHDFDRRLKESKSGWIWTTEFC